MNGLKFRYRPVDEVIHEMENCGSRIVSINDADFFGTSERPKELMRALNGRGIQWQAGVTSKLDVNKNDESLGTVRRFPRRFRPFLLPGESLRRRDGVVCEFRGKDRVGCGKDGEAADQKARGASKATPLLVPELLSLLDQRCGSTPNARLENVVLDVIQSEFLRRNRKRDEAPSPGR